MTTTDRSLGFALAAADVLFEVTPQAAIGVVEGLGLRDPALRPGAALSDVLMPESCENVKALIASLAEGVRAAPLTALLKRTVDGHRVAMFSAYRLPGVPWVACALTYERQGGSRPALNLDGIVAAATTTEAAGATISLIDIGNLSDGLRHLPGGPAATLIRDVEIALAAASIDGKSVSCVGDDRYAVVHKPGEQSAMLEAVRAAGARAGVELTPEAAGLDLPADDPMVVAAALRSVLDKFMTGGIPSGGSLKEFFERAIAEIRTRVAGFLAVVREQRVKLLFQPIVDLSSGAVHHHEVLARFGHTADTEAMIRTAEDLRLITRFDITVAERAVARLRRDAAMGLKLAINVSSKSLETDDYLIALTSFTAMSPDIRSRLSLEVTETATIADLTPVANRIGALREAGFRIYIDDFGSGSASLDYIRAFPVDAVKIDGKFVRQAATDERALMMIRHVVQLCSSLGLDTVAEQVETEEIAALMRDCGVNYGQGWLWGKADANPLMAIPAAAAQAA